VRSQLKLQLIDTAVYRWDRADQGRRPKSRNQPIDKSGETTLAQNHYSTKTKRRPKSSKRKDPSAATMAALRKLEAATKK
jgi:hypothetical protein